MSEEKNSIEKNADISDRLKLAELQVERSKAVMDSLAGFCHALGQPATVILSGVELMRMPNVDPALREQILTMCYDASLQIRNLLAEMKQKREYVAESYLLNTPQAGTMLSLPEWRDKLPPKASWEK